jgi:hypothetical protein
VQAGHIGSSNIASSAALKRYIIDGITRTHHAVVPFIQKWSTGRAVASTIQSDQLIALGLVLLSSD